MESTKSVKKRMLVEREKDLHKQYAKQQQLRNGTHTCPVRRTLELSLFVAIITVIGGLLMLTTTDWISWPLPKQFINGDFLYFLYAASLVVVTLSYSLKTLYQPETSSENLTKLQQASATEEAKSSQSSPKSWSIKETLETGSTCRITVEITGPDTA